MDEEQTKLLIEYLAYDQETCELLDIKTWLHLIDRNTEADRDSIINEGWNISFSEHDDDAEFDAVLKAHINYMVRLPYFFTLETCSSSDDLTAYITLKGLERIRELYVMEL